MALHSETASEDLACAYLERLRIDACLLYLRGRMDGLMIGLDLAAEVVTLVCRKPDGTWDAEARASAERHIEQCREAAIRQVRHDVYAAHGQMEKAAAALKGEAGDA